MDPATIVKPILVTGIIGIVVSIGARSRPEDTLSLVRKPMLGVRAMVSMFVLVPLFVLWITWAVDLDQPVRAAMLALAVSPMPPIIANKEKKVGGDGDYSTGLQVLGTIVSIVAVPFMLMLAAVVFGVSGSFDPFAMSKLLIVTVAAPLAIGMALGRYFTAQKAAIAYWSGRIGTIALAVGVVPLLWATSGAMIALVGNGVLLVIMAITGFALAVGHWLGGPDAGNRGALAVASAARHPGVAIALSTGVFPDASAEITAAVLLFLLANLLLTIPYVRWRQKVAGRR
jgi:BASS family bile acid:Na+ symporter